MWARSFIDHGPILAHQADPLVELGEASHEAVGDPPAAPEVVPTRLERLELKRVERIAKAPRTHSERAQAYQEGMIDDMPSQGRIALALVCKHASYFKPMRSPEKPMWKAKANADYLSLTSNSTWELFSYSRDMKVIGSMWKFKLKRDSKFKARLVARCDHRQPD